ncbi:MAG: Nif3-like dinuclear metal center hexameric protein, partial [Gemmatimonadaceae bacterium]
MASLAAVVDFLDQELRTSEVPDYPGAINGLQVSNSGSITHVAAAVDFSTRTVRAAAERSADLLLVHHGMFWGGAAPITGMMYDRVAMLLEKNIAVYGSHIPLDLHPRFGNNALLARELGLTPSAGFAMLRGVAVGVSGVADIPTRSLGDKAASLAARHGGAIVTTPLRHGQVTQRWGICTGAGASSETLKEAADLRLDTLIVGEGPHHTAVQAIDAGLTIIYAGHYATETLGVIALAE